jgi:hypothetical protein
MKRFSRSKEYKPLGEALTERQKTRKARFQKHSKTALATALAICTAGFSEKEADSVVSMMSALDSALVAEKEYKTLQKYGAAL